MEQSAFEAVMIGVSVFIFIIALTAGVLLMSNVIDMVNFANDQAIVGMNGTLAESVGVVTERTYTGTQMLRYYKEVMQQDNSPYILKVKLSEYGQEKAIDKYIQNEQDLSYLKNKFTLEYKGMENEKHIYVFSLVVENEDTL